MISYPPLGYIIFSLKLKFYGGREPDIRVVGRKPDNRNTRSRTIRFGLLIALLISQLCSPSLLQESDLSIVLRSTSSQNNISKS